MRRIWSRYVNHRAYSRYPLDAASGDDEAGDNTLGTFNPLFPNGYYFTLAGYTGYTNLIHLKPSLTVKPTTKLALMIAPGLQWRETTADAVYVQPDNPVSGTAGKAGQWSGVYVQSRADWEVTPSVRAAVEAVRFQIGDALRRAGGHDSTASCSDVLHGLRIAARRKAAFGAPSTLRANNKRSRGSSAR